MSQRRFGLRLRVLAILIGAGLLSAAVLAVALLLGARDEITRRHVASARAGLRAVAESIGRRCAGDGPCAVRAAEAAGLSWREGATCGVPQRTGDRLIACEEAGGAAVSEQVDLAPAGALESGGKAIRAREDAGGRRQRGQGRRCRF